MDNQVLPGILEQDQSSIEKKLAIVNPFTKTIHIDLLDGIFAPHTSFLTPSFFSAYKNDYAFELHMMVDDPITYVKPWAEAGISRFIGHVERMPDQASFVSLASDFGEVALGLDIDTPLEKIEVPIYDLDAVLIMTVKAGMSGQSFKEEALEKVRLLRSQASLVIEVDGGINDQTIQKALQAGANRFVATSFLFGSEDPKAKYQELTTLCHSYSLS